MEPVTIILLFLVLPVILVVIGLSLVSQGLNGLDYNANKYSHGSYVSNPFIKRGLHLKWRPTDSVVITQNKWRRIQAGLELEIKKARQEGIDKGKAAALNAIQASLIDKKPTKNMFKILKLTADQINLVDEREKNLLALYKPENFEYLDDPEFVRLAKIRSAEIIAAAKRVRNYK